jgi:uncharacterized protein YodC (DUF2158 family)
MNNERIWDDVPMSKMCCICELEEGTPIPTVMSTDPASKGKYVCLPCFTLWYDGFSCDTEKIKERRLKDLESKK